MTLRNLAILAISLIALSIIWAKRQVLAELVALPPPPPAQIQFDNGTVRQYRPTMVDRSTLPAGTMRKCVNDHEVVYTEVPCHSGQQERIVAGPPINIVPAQAPAASNSASMSDKAKTPLAAMLGTTPDTKLRERMMEQAINGSINGSFNGSK